ncbi:MAG: hypothetical protein AB1806_18505 [Acidobacteriota bacterium]
MSRVQESRPPVGGIESEGNPSTETPALGVRESGGALLRKATDRDLVWRFARQRIRAAGRQPRLLFTRLNAWIRFRRRVRRYRIIDEAQLLESRKSKTLFIFGSGASLNAIHEDEWREFERHDTLGFTWFVRQRFLRCDYHLIRELAPARGDRRSTRVQLEEYFAILRSNPLFLDAVFLVQTGWRAINGNQAIGYGLLPERNRVFLWRTLIGPRQPSTSLARGLTHAFGTLNECVNIGFLLGWTRIVLVGIDLYDRRYFWLEPAQASDARRDEPHSTAQQGIVDLMGQWHEFLGRCGVDLFVHNPRSLLAKTLPVWPESSLARTRTEA